MPPPSSITIEQALRLAAGHQQAGRLAEAEAIYRQVLAQQPNSPAALHLLGVLLFQRGRKEEGIALVRQAIAAKPDYAEAMSNLGYLLSSQERYEEAAQQCRQCVALKPDFAGGYVNLGSALFGLGKQEEAIAALRRAVALQPDFCDAWTNLGNALKGVGEYPEALAAHRRALTINANFPEGLNNLGATLQAMDRVDDAIACYRRAVELRPNYSEAWSNLGFAHLKKKMCDEAIGYCHRALEARPDDSGPYCHMGSAYYIKGDMERAMACFRQAVALNPRNFDAFNNMGTCLHDLCRLGEALGYYQQAMAVRPDFACAMGNIGNTLRLLGRLEEAIDASNRAIALDAKLPEAHSSLAAALHKSGQLPQAIASIRKAISLRPDYAEAHVDLAMMLLIEGRYEEGWREYEWRAKLLRYFNAPSRFAQPVWDGSLLAGRTILLHAEQGMGDTIQFIRYVPLVQQRGGRVIIECVAALKSLLEKTELLRQTKIIVRAGRAAPAIAFDVHLPLMSLPLVLGEFDVTDQRNLAKTPYIFADPEYAAKWQGLLPSAGIKIGLAWAGSRVHMGDRLRSMSLANFAPLARPDVTFYSLQVGDAADQAKNPPPGMNLVDLTGNITDFCDTAALIAQLDLVICVDTAVAHLAGAMDKPVWVFLPFIPDFRWLLVGESTALYPSMRLFRRGKSEPWDAVLARVAAALDQWTSQREKCNRGDAETRRPTRRIQE